MNHAQVGDKFIEDGDYAIVDSNSKSAETGDVVLALIDNKATIKRFIDDRKKNNQIVLRAESSLDYEPIYIHAEDDFNISGKVVGVIKNPN
jgi:SOS-response transcriptional repressor LexA